MYCEHCGSKLEDGTEFCSNCGKKVSTPTDNSAPLAQDIYYGQDWPKKGLGIASVPCFDILIDDKNFYLLKLPTSNAGSWWMLLGFLLGNLIGAIIGAALGNSSDKKKKERYRRLWITPEHILISKAYEPYVYLKIPLATLKQHMVQTKPKLFTLTFGDIKVSIKGSREGMDKLNTYINAHVL